MAAMQRIGTESDQELIAACLHGDTRAWETLVRRYANLVYSVPLRCGLSEDDAADVFQDTWSIVWEHLDELRDRSRLGPWLLTVVGRRSAQQLRQRRGRAGRRRLEAARIEEADRDVMIQPEAMALLCERSAVLREAVEQLPERCRSLLHYLFYDPTAPEYTEIATRLGVAPATIGPLRSRCLRELRALLEEGEPP